MHRNHDESFSTWQKLPIRRPHLTQFKAILHEIVTGDTCGIAVSNEAQFANKDAKTIEICVSQVVDSIRCIAWVFVNRLRMTWCFRSGFIDFHIHPKHQLGIRGENITSWRVATWLQDYAWVKRFARRSLVFCAHWHHESYRFSYTKWQPFFLHVINYCLNSRNGANQEEVKK